MNMLNMRLFFRLGAVFALQALVLSCSTSIGEFSPQTASPPPFDYADGEVLRSRMHQLAFASQRLDVALLTQEEFGIAAQREVVTTLRDIERIAAELEEGDLSTTHRFLRDRMQNFRDNVGRAIRSAERNPPRFYAAGQVTGSCVNCHRTVQ